MAKQHGKSATFTYNAVDLTSYMTSITLPRSRDTSDATAMGDTDKVNLAGVAGFTVELAGWFDPTASTGPDAVLAAAFAGGTAQAWIYGPAGSATGSVKYSGSGFVTSYQVTSPVEDTVAFTATITGTGAVTRTTF